MNEKVKKVFELLGVEPNEKFKLNAVGNKNDVYCLDEKLTGHIYDKTGKEYGFFVEWLLPSMLINPERIIKLPKEPKKKKLRDLTGEEWDRWLKKNCGTCNCDKCVFDRASCEASYSDRSWVNNKDIYSDKFLNQEIEVEE